jgi:hypothetical protein
MQMDPVLTPVVPVRDKLEVAAIQEMERVGHPPPFGTGHLDRV